MDISFLSGYTVPVIVGICLCVGFILKNTIKTTKINKYIPLIMGALGVALSVWINWGNMSPEVILYGLVSGLSSTGLFEVFKNMIKGGK